MDCGGNAAGGIPAPGGPGGSFAASGVLVGKDANYDGMIEKREMGFIPTGVVAGNAGGGGGGMVYGGGAGGSYGGGMVAGGGQSGAMMAGGAAMAGGMSYSAGGGGAGYGGASYGHGGGVPAPGGPGGSFAATGVLVGKDANYDGRIQQNEMGFIATGGIASGGGMPGPAPGPDDGDCGDCVRTVTTYKTVQVPCTRNRYKVVNYTVPKTVPYTDYTTVTKMREVTKQVPKTIYVPVKTTEPYQDRVPVTKYKTININKQRTECEPHTKIVTRRIPVVNVVPCPPQPCPPQPCDDNGVTPLPEPMPRPVPY